MLLPYSERHFQRLDRLLQSSYLVEHTLASMKMLVAAGGDSNTNGNVKDRDVPLKRPLVGKMKRLRDGRRPGEGDTIDGSGRRGVDPDVESIESGSDVEGGTGLPTPLSEVVDGEVLFNVRLERSRVDGISSGDDYSSGSERGAEEEDVMREAVTPVEADSGVKKKSKKKASKGNNGEKEEVIPEGGEEAVAAAVGGGTEDGESGKTRTKRRRRRASVDDATSVGLVNLKKQRDEDGTVENGDVDGEGEGKEASAGSSKKKKKRRRRSTPSACVADAAQEGDERQGIAESVMVDARQERREKENEGEGGGREEGGLGGGEKDGKKIGRKKKRRKSAS